MKELLLGIDIGTSACKVAFFTPDGKVAAQNSGEYKIYYPKPGWVEQNPDEWWEVLCSTLRTTIKDNGINTSGIKGIGIDGQSWSAIPINKEGRVLANNPIWMDARSADICDELSERIGEEKIFAVCGNPMQPAYTLPKILWYKKHLPYVYENTYKILQSNSFIAYKLTGAVTQDISQGYGLQCFDMRKGCWNTALCEEMGISSNLLPEVVPSHMVVGYVTKEAAEATGLAEGTPVVAGGLDAACGTLGAGVIHSGQTQEQGGQAGGMSICTDEYKADPRLILSHHVVPGKWLLQGGTVGGGGAIKWFEREFCAHERSVSEINGTSSFYEMDKLAQAVPHGSEGLIFLPYMSGERSPIWDTKAKGVFYGLDFSKTRAHLIRATLEGVAYSLLHNLDTAKEAGAEAEVLCSMGGAANSRLWTQIKADVTGKKIVVPSSDTATSLGAAILAGVGTGIYKSFEQAVDMTIKITREHTPDMGKHEQYRQYYNQYLKIYQDLKETMHQ